MGRGRPESACAPPGTGRSTGSRRRSAAGCATGFGTASRSGSSLARAWDAICSTRRACAASGRITSPAAGTMRTLEPALSWQDDQLERFLCSLPEISRKSAYCIMMYALGRAVFPVDTHVGRVLSRLHPYRELGLSQRQSDPRGDLPVEVAAAISSRRSFYEVRAAHSPETVANVASR